MISLCDFRFLPTEGGILDDNLTAAAGSRQQAAKKWENGALSEPGKLNTKKVICFSSQNRLHFFQVSQICV